MDNLTRLIDNDEASDLIYYNALTGLEDISKKSKEIYKEYKRVVQISTSTSSAREKRKVLLKKMEDEIVELNKDFEKELKRSNAENLNRSSCNAYMRVRAEIECMELDNTLDTISLRDAVRIEQTNNKPLERYINIEVNKLLANSGTTFGFVKLTRIDKNKVRQDLIDQISVVPRLGYISIPSMTTLDHLISFKENPWIPEY